MEKEKTKKTFIPWYPSKDLTEDYLAHTLIPYHQDGTSIIMKSKGKPDIEINFGDAAFVSVTDEGVRNLFIEEVIDQLGEEGLHIGARFIVEDSDLMEWIIKESYYLGDIGVKHYVVLDSEYVYDVITRNEPKITVLD